MVFVLRKQVRAQQVAGRRAFAGWVENAFAGIAGVVLRAEGEGVAVLAENERLLERAVEKLHVYCAPHRLEVGETQIVRSEAGAEPVMRLIVGTTWACERRLRMLLAARGARVVAAGNCVSGHTLYALAGISRLRGLYEELHTAAPGQVRLEMEFSHYEEVQGERPPLARSVARLRAKAP